MPDQTESNLITHDNGDKKGQPLVAASENLGSYDASDDADERSDNTDIVTTRKTQKKGAGGASTSKKRKQSRETTGVATREDDKENSTEPVRQAESQDQKNQQAKSSGLCSGKKSVEVKDTTKPIGESEQVQASNQKDGEDGRRIGESENKGDISNTGKKEDTPKKSVGFCRSNKDVEVIDSVKSPQARSKSDDDSKAPDLKTEPPTEISTNAKETGGVKAATGNKSGGFCKKEANVAILDSTTGGSKPAKVSNSNSKLRDETDLKGSEKAPQKQTNDVPSQPTNQKSPTGKSGTCCGGRSVEVKESLRPLDKSEKEAGPKDRSEKEAGPKPKEAQDDSFGEPIYLALPDLSLEDDKEENADKETSEESIEERDNDDVTESDASEEIIIKPEPPPPILKKKRKKEKKKTSTEYVQETPTKGAPLAMNPRKGKYSVTTSAQEQEEEPIYAQVESSPAKKKSIQSKLTTAADVEAKDTPSRKKKKKKLNTETQDDIRSAYENQIASLAATSGSEGGFTINDHPTVEEESELLENAEAERKKNKQRLREKKYRESGKESPVKKGDATNQAYENAQREIDRVLAPKIVTENQEEDSDDSDKKKKKKSKEKSKKKKKEKREGEENGGYSSEEKVEESLEEAKAKMHQLLDDAFSLFSHSRSSISNKVAPAKQSSEEKESPKSKKKRSPRSETASNKSSPREDSKMESPREEEKKHTPMHIVRSHEPYDNSGLISWDPYKASDETAIISLPTTQTNLSSNPPQQEKLATSTFTASLPGSLRPNYYATQPAEPIIIKSSELGDPENPPPSGKDYYISPGKDSSMSIGKDHYTSPRYNSGALPTGTLASTVDHQGTFQNPLYSDSLAPQSQSSNARAVSRHAPPYHQQPAKTVRDTHYEPYYGMSSYQEIPQTSTIPGQPDQNQYRSREATALNGIGTMDFSNPTYNSNQHYEMAVRSYGENENFSRGRGDATRDSKEGGGEIMSHTAPQRGDNPNLDVVDAVSSSLRPGASPQPLINSLREELQMLASRRGNEGANKD